MNKGQEWWEISRNPNPQLAMIEEHQELLEEARWGRRNFGNVPGGSPKDGKGYTSKEDIHNFGKKGSDGGHFWDPEKERWYMKFANDELTN